MACGLWSKRCSTCLTWAVLLVLPLQESLVPTTLKQSVVLSTVQKSQAKQSAWGLKYHPLTVERAADERD